MEEPHFIKCESELPGGEEDTTDFMPNPLLPTADDTLVEIKVEPCHVFADQTFDEAGASTVKEEYEIQDMKIEAQDEEHSTLTDSLQDVEKTTVLRGPTEYWCDICCKGFDQRKYLIRHLWCHKRGRPFSCPVCKVSFTQKGNLKTHMLTHSAEKQYTCSQCGKAFHTPNYLRRHEIRHTNVRPHQCSVCEKTFKQLTHLQKHEYTHTKSNPVSKSSDHRKPRKRHTDNGQYICSICGSEFRKRQVLIGHIETHTAQKPYRCKICDKAFTRPATLKQHKVSMHTKLRPYECTICGKSFPCRSNLNKHKFVHNDELPFFCTMCGY
ncbi:zinc finger protein 852 isoform X2 [Anabrus simplex]|uniref:zinc finger protein 852 isoform X2 n=1 Tax=Anabrus simplex TaxID=316456 RepID=UPI0035A397F3